MKKSMVVVGVLFAMIMILLLAGCGPANCASGEKGQTLVCVTAISLIGAIGGGFYLVMLSAKKSELNDLDHAVFLICILSVLALLLVGIISPLTCQ